MHFLSKKLSKHYDLNVFQTPFLRFENVKNRWDQLKKITSGNRFSKTFIIVAQMDAFLENLTFLGNDSALFYHADRMAISGSVILTWCHGISPIFNFRKRGNC